MARIKWLLLLAGLCWATSAIAELPVQQSWHCQAGEVLVVSNTPCQDGAQAVTPATSVIYHCQRNGVSSFQQRPCGVKDGKVYLYSDVRSADAIASGEQVRASTVARANAVRTQPMRTRGGGGVTVVGTTATSSKTAGDGSADGYRVPNRSAGATSGY